DLFHSAGWNVEGWVHSKESAARLSVKLYSTRVLDVSQGGEVAKRTGVFDAVIHCASSRGGDAEAYRQIYLNGARLSDVTAPCDQDSPHVLEHRFQQAIPTGKMPADPSAKMAVLLGGSDFNLVKHVFLKGPDLLQSD